MPAATAWYPVFTDLMLIARHHTAFEKAGELAQFVAFHLQVRGKEPGRMDKLDWVGKRNCSNDFGTLGSLLFFDGYRRTLRRICVFFLRFSLQRV